MTEINLLYSGAGLRAFGNSKLPLPLTGEHVPTKLLACTMPATGEESTEGTVSSLHRS